MPLCISCGRAIPEGKRKHAVYCDSKCRGNQYRKRHPKPANTESVLQQRSSTLLECPCGRRYLLSVTELHDEHNAEASASAPPESVTRTDSTTKECGARSHANAEPVATQAATQTDSQPEARCVVPHVQTKPVATQTDSQSEARCAEAHLQTEPVATQTDSQPEARGAEPHLRTEPANRQTVLQTVSPLAPSDRQPAPNLDHLPESATQTVAATDVRSSGDSISAEDACKEKILMEHIQMILSEMLRTQNFGEALSRYRPSQGNKAKRDR